MAYKTRKHARATHQREAYMAQFEALVTASKPELAGRIDWNTATYFYNNGIALQDAATRYLAHH